MFFSYTFAFEKRTQHELSFGQYEKAAFASPRSGHAPSLLQYQKQDRTDASDSGGSALQI